MDSLWKATINDVKLQRLCSVEGTSLNVINSVWLVIQIVLKVADIDSLIAKTLGATTLLSMAIIHANVRKISPNNEISSPLQPCSSEGREPRR